jgi:phosphoribosylaminoimidazole-succinocarboxamide synthase
VGRGQESFDKQFLRDWLVEAGLKGVEGVCMPDLVVQRTGEKYREVFEILTGTKAGGFEP